MYKFLELYYIFFDVQLYVFQLIFKFNKLVKIVSSQKETSLCCHHWPLIFMWRVTKDIDNIVELIAKTPKQRNF